MFSSSLYLLSWEMPLGIVSKSYFKKGHRQIGGGLWGLA